MGWTDNIGRKGSSGTKTKKSGGGWTSNIGKTPKKEEEKPKSIQKLETEIANKKAGLERHNIPLPSDDDRNWLEKSLNLPKKQGFVMDTFDLLSRGQYASAGAAKKLAEGKGIGEALKASGKGFTGRERTSYDDVLDEMGMEAGWKRSALGFTGDVLLDPLTYLTLGYGAGAKAGTTGARGLGKVVSKATGKEILDKGGLKFAGLPVIPQNVIDKGLEVTKLADAGRAIRDSKPAEVLGKAFIPNFREAGTDKEVWDAFVDLKRGYRKGLEYEQHQAVDRALELGKNLTKEERELVTHGIQNPILLKGQRQEVINAAREARKIFERIGKEEVEKGLLSKARKNYLPGIYPEKGKSALEGIVHNPSIRASIGKHSKAKKFDTLQEAIDAGLKPETDISKLVGLRGVVNKRAVTTQNFIDDVVNQFGQKVSPKDIDNLPENMGIYLPKGNLRFFPQGTVPKEVLELMKGMSSDDLIEIPASMIRKGMGVSKNVPMVALPKQIASELNNFKKSAWDEGTKGAMKYLYDTPLSLWKAYATATNPGFHIRNALSNMFQTYLNNGGAMLNPINHIKAGGIVASDLPVVGKKIANKTIDVGGQRMTIQEAKDLMKKEGVLNQGWFDKEIGQMIEDNLNNGLSGKLLPGKGLGKANVINPLSQNNALIRAGRAIGSGVENQARAFNFLADVKKTGDMKQAAKNADKFLFDYGDLTDFERNVMRRAVPFYTWLRKNTPLQAEQLLKQPGKYAAVPKAMNAIENQSDPVDEKYLPKHMDSWVRTPLKQGGNPLYWNPNMPYGDLDNLNPYEIEENAFGAMTPFAKAPIELMTNRNFFFQSPIEKYKDQKVPAPGYAPLLPKPLQKAMGITEKVNEEGKKELVMPAKSRYLTKQVPFAENISRSLEYEDDKKINHLLSFLAGARVSPYDFEKGEINAKYEERQELRDLFDKLIDEGVLPEDWNKKPKKKSGWTNNLNK